MFAHDFAHNAGAGRLAAAVLLVGAALAAVPADAAAQYFGRNRVQYQTFDFQVMETPDFSIYFYPEAAAPIRDAGRMAERWNERLSRIFGTELGPGSPVILYADHPDFQQTNIIDAQLGEATGGVTEGLRTRVVMPLTGIYAENDHVLGHELVHAFQFTIARGPGGSGLRATGRLPLWFVEGMAEYLSLGRDDPHTAMWLRDAMLRDDLPGTRELTRDPRYFPYRFGHALMAYIGGRYGDESINLLYRSALQRGVDGAIEDVLGITADSLSAEWRAAVRREYGPLVAGRTLPADAGELLLAPQVDAGDMNLAPAVSPDGRFVAFLSERDLFTIDLFLADATTGRVIRRLVSADSDPHFDALSFVRSAGSWSPDGNQLAVTVFRRGANEIAIVDVARGRVVRSIRVTEVGAIWDPAWSPDGGRIAFGGSSGGIGNLYVVDLATGRTEKLTDDRSAALQPAWSPDGRTLAYATDRGPGTDFADLSFAPMRLALLDLESGETELIEPFAGAKHINPQFSPDGRDLYFVSDRDGFSDIYRLSRTDGQVHQVTRLATGVSGLTELSTAFSVAQREGRILFSAFDDGNYHVYRLPAALAPGGPLAPAVAPQDAGAAEPEPRNAGILPPAAAYGEGIVAQYLADPVTGLVDPGEFIVESYRPRLALDYVGVPQVGVGVDAFGAQIGGGMAAMFSDMLGDRVLGAEVWGSGELRDVGGQLFYQNRRHRWNLATGVGRIPYQTGFTTVRPDPQTGGREVEQFRERVAVNQVLGDARYPLNMNQRFEGGLAFSRLGFSREVERFILVGNQIVSRERERLPTPPALNLIQVSGAFVGDNSFFGFTSPVRGGRYRAELEPSFGTLTYQTALADYRRYFFRTPITFAIRALHLGRYGSDADTDRLPPFFLGYETLVRGYSIQSFRPEECSNDLTDSCPEFDRLVGSRIGVANAELRVPLFGTADFGLIEFPYLPTELSLFLDGGVAWTGAESPVFELRRRSDERTPVFSTGLSARFNVLGYLVLETFYAIPFQRPDRGGFFGFNFAPGW